MLHLVLGVGALFPSSKLILAGRQPEHCCQALPKPSAVSGLRGAGRGFGDKFGESLGGSQATPSFWEAPGLPRKFPKLPRKFFGDFPGSSFTAELYSNPGVPRKFPRLPRKFPGLPRKFPGLPRRSALSLGSLTPSPDSQKLSLKDEHAASSKTWYISIIVNPRLP